VRQPDGAHVRLARRRRRGRGLRHAGGPRGGQGDLRSGWDAVGATESRRCSWRASPSTGCFAVSSGASPGRRLQLGGRSEH